METKVNFTKIKEQLPYGAQSEIAKMAKVHINTVNKVLSGNSDNVAVINAIADYLELKKTEKNAALDRISSFID